MITFRQAQGRQDETLKPLAPLSLEHTKHTEKMETRRHYETGFFCSAILPELVVRQA